MKVLLTLLVTMSSILFLGCNEEVPSKEDINISIAQTHEQNPGILQEKMKASNRAYSGVRGR